MMSNFEKLFRNLKFKMTMSRVNWWRPEGNTVVPHAFSNEGGAVHVSKST